MLARPLITDLESFKWDVDVITPVPLGLARLVQRGYNQSALLARPLALALGVRYYPQSLRRSRETRSQVGLSAAQRKENVIGAFEARSDLVSGRNILVVDDVTTSGATLEACAVALFDAGALKVFGLTLARAVLKFPQVREQPIIEC
jgi:ComF family protein